MKRFWIIAAVAAVVFVVLTIAVQKVGFIRDLLYPTESAK